MKAPPRLFVKRESRRVTSESDEVNELANVILNDYVLTTKPVNAAAYGQYRRHHHHRKGGFPAGVVAQPTRSAYRMFRWWSTKPAAG